MLTDWTGLDWTGLTDRRGASAVAVQWLVAPLPGYQAWISGLDTWAG